MHYFGSVRLPVPSSIFPELTDREHEILALIAQGYKNPEIATRLVVSPKTVGTHIEHIYSKIGCSTRAAASLYAMQRGLLPARPH